MLLLCEERTAPPGVRVMQPRHLGLMMLAIAVAAAVCCACAKRTDVAHAPPSIPRGGAKTAPASDAIALEREYPNLAGLPRMEDLVPKDRHWGVPPLNQEAPFVPKLPAYQGWCRCDTWQTEVVLANSKVVLARMLYRLTAIDAATGTMLWQDATTDFGYSEVAVIDGTVVNQWGNYASDLATGKRLDVSAELKRKLGNGLHPQSDPGWIPGQQHEGGSDPLPPECLVFLAGFGMKVVGTSRVGERLYAAAEWSQNDNTKNFGVSYTYLLFAFDLNPAGTPIPGKLKLVSPADPTQTVAAFYACPKPLGNDALMRRIVAGGTPLLKELLGQVERATPDQMLALAVLCQYCRPENIDWATKWDLATELLGDLEKNPTAKNVPALAVLLGTGADCQVAERIACLLARIGGPVAKDALLRAYDAWTYVRRTPRQPPYPVGRPNFGGSTDDDWFLAKTASGPEYAAFTNNGLASWRDLYLGLDADGDGKYEEVLYTGLGNSFFSVWFPGGRDERDKPKGPLKLELKDGQFFISHHEPRIRWRSTEWDGGRYKYGDITGARYTTSACDLAHLRVDSDSDGLPDRVEQSLLLDLQSADTDGDGLLDGIDALPNLDQAKLGKLERGVQRAIICDTLMAGSLPDNSFPLPWDATYFYVKGAGPLAVSPVWYGMGISLRDTAEMQRYQKLLRGSNDFGKIHVTVLDLRGVNSSLSRQELDRNSAEYWAADNDKPTGTVYTVLLDFPGAGDYVHLVAINGELFPAAVGSSWMS